MTRSAPLLGPEFDNFLLAPIGEEKNGMLLSVLSALARLNIDPWQEATALAGLPRETATRKLAELIAALPDEGAVQRDSGTIAARLIALLPRPAISTVAAVKTLRGVSTITSPRAILYVVVLLVALGIQLFVATRQPSAPTDSASATSSSDVSSPVPPPAASQ